MTQINLNTQSKLGRFLRVGILLQQEESLECVLDGIHREFPYPLLHMPHTLPAYPWILTTAFQSSSEPSKLPFVDEWMRKIAAGLGSSTDTRISNTIKTTEM